MNIIILIDFIIITSFIFCYHYHDYAQLQNVDVGAHAKYLYCQRYSPCHVSEMDYESLCHHQNHDIERTCSCQVCRYERAEILCDKLIK